MPKYDELYEPREKVPMNLGKRHHVQVRRAQVQRPDFPMPNYLSKVKLDVLEPLPIRTEYKQPPQAVPKRSTRQHPMKKAPSLDFHSENEEAEFIEEDESYFQSVSEVEQEQGR